MVNSVSSGHISRLKRQAKMLRRKNALTHAKALDQIAAGLGFANWSLLVKASISSAAFSKTKREPTHALGQTRHYLHGDQEEADASQYYCERCDSFCEAGHFRDARLHRGQSHEERYLDSKQRWHERGVRWKAIYRRPDNPVNLLAAKAEVMNIAYQAARSPFHRWLMTQLDRDDEVSDLAVDIRSDKLFPVSVSSQHEISAYLSKFPYYVQQAFELAWKEFSSNHRNR